MSARFRGTTNAMCTKTTFAEATYSQPHSIKAVSICGAGRWTVNYFRGIVMEANEAMKANRRGFLQDAASASASLDLGGLPFATRATLRAAQLK